MKIYGMKYALDQTVMLLDIHFKPAYSATVKGMNEDNASYLVEYQYADSDDRAQLWVPQERLTPTSEVIHAA